MNIAVPAVRETLPSVSIIPVVGSQMHQRLRCPYEDLSAGVVFGSSNLYRLRCKWELGCVVHDWSSAPSASSMFAAGTDFPPTIKDVSLASSEAFEAARLTVMVYVFVVTTFAASTDYR